jgi:hypothetical protein
MAFALLPIVIPRHRAALRAGLVADDDDKVQI